MLVAVIFSFFTFLGMAYLINTPRINTSTSIEMVDFTKIRDIKPIDHTKPMKRHEKPKQKQVKQPPVAPKLDITQSESRNDIYLPTGVKTIKNLELAELSLNKIGMPDGSMISNGDLVQMFTIAPVYPADALRNKTEGWVKVEFIVNEFGEVGHIKIIDAQPRGVFENATKRALRKSKFKPLMVDGISKSQTAVQVIEFKLEK